MPLSAGTMLGPYEILASIGAGGMGEVYRARDTRLDRIVAVKVAKEKFSERFEREAQAVAALNHPHICTLYDVGPAYLVMEYIEGTPLRGPLQLDQALKYSAQICDALDAAHSKGITHRDLKPANILVTKSGAVKLLDFGLAKRKPIAKDGDETLTMALTGTGQIVGTLYYMSPEQLQGQEAGPESDIFSFGLVLYEMLTGKRAFDGKTSASVIAAIMERPAPSASEVAPPALDHALKRCLEKDPERRWQSARDLKAELEWIGTSRQASGTELPPQAKARLTRRSWFWPSLAAFVALALMPANILHFREQPPVQQMLQYTLPVPEKDQTIQQFAISPDGHYVVMKVIGGGAGPQLWVRPTDSLQAQLLPGTANGDYPFWSPDSRYIGFFADGKLKRIAVSGGPAQALCDAPNGRGGAWNEDGVILFAPTNNGGLSRVSAAGGVPVPVTKAIGRVDRSPRFLPDGRRFLMAASGSESGIYLGSFDGKVPLHRVLADPSYAAYFNGHLLFVRDGTLMAQPVDPKTFEFKGDVFPVAERVSSGRNLTDEQYSISANGILVFQTGAGPQERQHIWKDRTGKDLGQAGGVMPSGNGFALSPDGKRFVTERRGGTGGEARGDLWITDLEHSTDTRLTTEAPINQYPVWSPDGSKIVFESIRKVGNNTNLYQRTSNGIGQDELLLESNEQKSAWDWSRDGRFIVYMVRTPKADDIWVLPTTGDKKPFPLLQSEFQKRQAQISPDERWLAYTSVESARPGIYVVPFTPAAKPDAKPVAGKWTVSTAGGTQPRWRGDGKELFYVAPDGKLMAVEIKATAAAFDHGAPQALFDLHSAITPANTFTSGYVVAPDGKRFLVVTEPSVAAEAPPLMVVVNWLAAVKK